MSDGWGERRLGEFATRKKVINEVGEDLPPLSVTKDRGVLLQSEKYKKRVATDPRKYVVVEDGDFAFDPMSLYYGALGRVNGIGRGLISPDYVAFTVDSTVVPEFLEYKLRSREMIRVYERVAQAGNQFGKRRRVYWSVLAELPVRLPSLTEQRGIAATLKAADRAVAAGQQVLEQSVVVKTAALDSWCSEERCATRGWELKTLDELVAPDRPICYGILMPGHGVPGGVPVVKVRNMKNGAIDEADLLLTSPEIDHQYARSRLRAGDLLLSIRGTTGRLARVPASLERANITQDSARLSIRSEFEVNFVYQCLQSSWLQRQIREHTRGQAVKGINIGDVRRLVLPAPPRDEQRSLAEAMGEFDERISAEQSALDQLRAANMSLQARLLSGELRFDPSKDER